MSGRSEPYDPYAKSGPKAPSRGARLLHRHRGQPRELLRKLIIGEIIAAPRLQVPAPPGTSAREAGKDRPQPAAENER
ncbi:MAG: hypothetical protein AAGC55_34230 [Myxococcota bacterium]